jgi:hypothetical protein
MEEKINSRRSFIKSAGVLAAGTFIIPKIKSHMDSNEKNQSAGHIAGQGNFKYKVHKDWGVQDLREYPVMDCHEMIQDKKGRLFLFTNHPKNNTIIYDRSGKVLATWTLGFKGAHGLTLSEEGDEEFLYLATTTDRKIYKTTLDGRVLLEIGYPKETGLYGAESDYLPTETAIGPNGDIYVADGYGLNYIMQYNPKGELIRYWGGKGDGNEQFDCCHGVTLDTRDAGKPCLLITSRSKQEFKRFTLDGQYLETISLPGCWICRPVVKGEYLYFAVLVTKTWGEYDGCLAVLDKNNKVVSFPGATAPAYMDGKLQAPEYDDYSFLNPHDVCIDQDENLYVPQWSSGRTYPVMLERVV